MTITLRESEGPDRFHSNLKCRQFHDLKDMDLGGDPNCCCCDPCNTLRPGVPTVLDDHEHTWCCRCVPRILFLEFVPDDPDDPCCHGMVSPMYHNRVMGTAVRDPDDPYYSVYSGLLFDYNVEVHVGEVEDNPTEGEFEGNCGWKILIRIGTGSPTTAVYEIDHSKHECINPPITTLIDNVQGPDGCIGTLIMYPIDNARLPFIERSETALFLSMRDYINDEVYCPEDVYGDVSDVCDHQFIDLCGNCELDEYGNDVAPSCVLVDGLTYLVDVIENGQSTYINGDNKLYWDNVNQAWLLGEFDYANTNPVLVDLIAVGPSTETCPIGLYERVSEDYYSYDDYDPCFCVSPCDYDNYLNCGCIGKVCSRICVKGPKHTTDPMNNSSDPVSDTYPQLLSEFKWFETWIDEPSRSYPIRGWSRYNLLTEKTERFYLISSRWIAILVDGVRWESAVGNYGFGDINEQRWTGILSSAESFVYWDGSQWAIMIGGNLSAYGPTTDEPFGEYVSIDPSGPTYTVEPANDYYDRDCILYPRLEEFEVNEMYQPTVIGAWHPLLPDGRSADCSFHEILGWGDGSRATSIDIRCGFCGYWTFQCGFCRCVPKELCVHYFTGSLSEEAGGAVIDTNVSNVILTWDEDIRGWADNNAGTDGGLTIKLEAGVVPSVDGWPHPCRLVISLDGYLAGNASNDYVWNGASWESVEPREINWPIHNCGSEVVSKYLREASPSGNKFFDPDNTDLLAFEYHDWGNKDKTISVFASSIMPDCKLGPCTAASPCADECGSHPLTLHMTIYNYGWYDDMYDPNYGLIDPSKVAIVEVELTYMQAYVGETLDCWYQGYIFATDHLGDALCPIEVRVSRSSVRLKTPLIFWSQLPDGSYYRVNYGCTPIFQGIMNQGEYFNFESPPTCNPYYAATAMPVNAGDTSVVPIDINCLSGMRIVITE